MAKKFIDKLPQNEKLRIIKAIQKLPYGEDIKKLKENLEKISEEIDLYQNKYYHIHQLQYLILFYHQKFQRL